MENSKIAWTTHTFNPWIGCTKVQPACEHCYAEADQDLRRHRVRWGPNGTRSKTSAEYWRQPLRWNAVAKAFPEDPQRVFCASLADVFEDWQGEIVDVNDRRLWTPPHGSVWDAPIAEADDSGYRPLTMTDMRESLFALIDETPHLHWLLLTKRPENIRKMWPVRQLKNDFPMMLGHGKSKLAFPSEILHEHEAQARRNHGGQTLARLAERGGLSPCEMVAILEDRDWEKMDQAIAINRLEDLRRTRQKSPRPNVWLGFSAGDQKSLDAGLPHLFACRDLTPVQFLSLEPLLGPVAIPIHFTCAACQKTWDWDKPVSRPDPSCPHCDAAWKCKATFPHWVIAGGESGKNARPMHPAWVRALRDQCRAAGVPFFFKQWGEWLPPEQEDLDYPKPLIGCHEVYVRSDTGAVTPASSPYDRGCPCDHHPQATSMVRIGTKHASDMLDGEQYHEFPKVATC